jgi:hypothetical protein
MAKEHEDLSNVSSEDVDAPDAESDHEPTEPQEQEDMDTADPEVQPEASQEPFDEHEEEVDENGEPKKAPISRVDYAKTINNDTTNRLEYLLKQTEIFSHFMTFGKDQPQKPKVGRKPKPKEIDVNDHRHRKTEEEEDEELLSESKKDLNLFRYFFISRTIEKFRCHGF